ncbi:hypothetical protein AN220_30150, partial [Streptomyces nanshensis]
GVDQAGYRAVLAAATRARPGVPLSAFVSMPAVEAAVRGLREAGADTLTAQAPESPFTGEDLRSWMFWARVKTYDALAGADVAAVARKVLHLGPDETVDAAREEELRRVLTRAFAEGRAAADPLGAVMDPDVAAAHHLQQSGLLGEATTAGTLGSGGETRTARDFTGLPVLPVVDLTTVEVNGAPQQAPWLSPREGEASRPTPSLVRGTLDRADRRYFLLTLPDGTTHRAPHSELPHLLAADPALQALDLAVDLVLDVPELDRYAPGLADDLAQLLGRGIWSTAATSGLNRSGRDGSSVLTLRPSAGDPDTEPTWTRSAPRDPAEPVYAPSPVPDPLP